MNYTLLAQRFIDGISNGVIYATVAVALVLIFKATTLINFAQGELAMIGAFIAYIFAVQAFQIPLFLAIIIAMIASAILGVVIERVLLRPFDPTDHLPAVLITLGIFFIVNAVAGEIWNYQPRVMPSLFPNGPKDFIRINGMNRDTGLTEFFMTGATSGRGGVRIFYDTLGTIVALGLMFLVLYVLLNRTKMGLAFRAVSSNTDSARLVGVKTGRILGFGWALACAFGTLGAVLVAPRLGGVQPIMMAVVLIYALAAASIGGLDSVGGAAVGGLIIGLVNSIGLGYLTDIDALSGLTATPLVPPLLLMLLTLWFKPSGLFGTKIIERV